MLGVKPSRVGSAEPSASASPQTIDYSNLTGPAPGAALAALIGSLILIASDFAVVYGAYFTGHLLRVRLLSRFVYFQDRGEALSYEAYLSFVPIYLVVFGLAGLYNRRVSAIAESASVLRAVFYATACTLMFASIAHVSEMFSRAVIAAAALLTAVLAPWTHLLIKSVLGRWKPWQRPVVLLGVNPNGLRAARDISSDRTMGYRVAGIFTDRPVELNQPWPVYRTPTRERVIELCRERAVHSFILCEESGDQAEMIRSIRLLESFADEIKIAAVQEGLQALRVQSEVLKSSYLLSYENPLTKPANRLLKRILDVCAGGVLCLLFLPAFVLIPLLIRFSSPGPVLFRQRRLGRGGKGFNCLKFRTMHADAAERLSHILAENESAGREFSATYKLRNDPRITRVGAWLRRTSLDEVPQLWNVLRGQMSLVGPRPIVPEETTKYDLELTNYLRVPSGLTGLWQISGRNDLHYAERVRLDLFYIRNWSIWLDLVILARTALHIIRPKGAY